VATITVRKLDDYIIDALKRRAAENGRSMEEEARRVLVQAVGSEQLQEQRKFVTRMRDPAVQALLPKGNGIDSVEIIREMREERDQQLMDATGLKNAPDR
jgi:plasmid stability protein